MEKYCDNKSVGVIVKNPKDETLLLNRARFPFGLAPPAGHIDDHGSPEQAAIDEVAEEVGLVISLSGLRRVVDARLIQNPCRRINGDHHVWSIYIAEGVDGDILASPDETIGARWWSHEEMMHLIERSQQHRGQINQAGEQLLEPIWLDLFTELKLF